MIEEKTASSEAVAAAKQDQSAAKSGKPAMHVKVYSPFKVYYDEDSYSISAVNATGPFDILPHHHNFMSLLEPGTLVVTPVSGDVPGKCGSWPSQSAWALASVMYASSYRNSGVIYRVRTTHSESANRRCHPSAWSLTIVGDDGGSAAQPMPYRLNSGR